MEPIPDQSLIDKYDTYYLVNPQKWAGPTGELRDRFALEALSSFLVRPPQKLMDIGCGNGHTLKYFSRRWPDTALFGMDLSPVAISLTQNAVPGAKLFTGFLHQLLISDLLEQRFDCLIGLGVFEHFERLHQYLLAVRELLTESGVVYAEMPNCLGYPKSERVEGFRELNVGNHQFEWHLSRESWDFEFKEAGFKIEKSLTGPLIETEFCYILSKGA